MRDLIILVKGKVCDIYIGEKNKCQQIKRVNENELCNAICNIRKGGDKIHIFTDAVETRIKVFTKAFWHKELDKASHSSFYYYGEMLNDLFFGDDYYDDYIFDYQYESEVGEDVSVSCARAEKCVIENYISMGDYNNFRITTIANYDNFRREFPEYFGGAGK